MPAAPTLISCAYAARFWARVLVCGGGRKNKILIEKIKKNSLKNIVIQKIDDYGISRTIQFKNIILPQLKPATFLAIVVTVIGSLRSFDMVAIMTQGGPWGSTNVLAYYMFETALSEYGYRMGYGSAIAAVLFTIMMFYILFFIYRMYQSEKKGL